LPVTPFHFGPGLALKGAAAPVFSWTAFAVATVLIDCESLYYLIRQEYPVHRFLHSLVGASLVGLIAALACHAFFHVRSAREPRAWGRTARSDVRGERAGLGMLLGGFAGGLSHPVLDGIMHRDVRPFMPWSDRNPFLGLVSETTLHLACVGAALAGVAGLACWRAATRAARPEQARVDRC
jgi:membrane-bound metal-dependent hydrolase YbcI (DUF457 family)